MNILKKIDEVQSGFDKEKYSVSSISGNIMDQVYAGTYMERTRIGIKEIDTALN